MFRRVGLALNYSVFLYEMQGQKEIAIAMAREVSYFAFLKVSVFLIVTPMFAFAQRHGPPASILAVILGRRPGRTERQCGRGEAAEDDPHKSRAVEERRGH